VLGIPLAAGNKARRAVQFLAGRRGIRGDGIGASTFTFDDSLLGYFGEICAQGDMCIVVGAANYPFFGET
jgi:hypothetical protein